MSSGREHYAAEGNGEEEWKDEEGEMLTLKWKEGKKEGEKRGLISQEGKGFQTKQ